MLRFLKKNAKTNLAMIIALVAFADCGTDKQKIIGEKVAERVESFRAKRMAECKESLLRDASRIADSLILEQAKAELTDSIHVPPIKPPRPAPLLPIDTLEVAPIFHPASSTRQ
jgi:hypothetical protein